MFPDYTNGTGRETFAQKYLTCKARLHNLSMTEKLYVYVYRRAWDEQTYDALGHAGVESLVVRCVHIICTSLTLGAQ